MDSPPVDASMPGSPFGSPGSIPSLPPLDNTLGAILIAEILISMLFGITSVQIYIYFGRNYRDNVWMKRTMITLWILDTLHLILTSWTLYHYTVLNFMNPSALTQCPWTFSVDMIVGGLSDFIVGVIFVNRIWKLSGKSWPVLLIVPIMLVCLAGAVAVCRYALQLPRYEDFKQHYAWIWYLIFGAKSCEDVAISIILTTCLIRRRTGFRKTNSIIRTLVMYSINTGILMSSVSLTAIITYVIMPDNLIFVAFAMVSPKLMLSSLVACINSRDTLREKSNRPEPLSIHLSNFAVPTTPNELPRLGHSTPQTQQSYGSGCKSDAFLDGIEITTDKIVAVSPA